MAEEIVVMEPGDERAQRIAKAMASQTASDILSALRDAPLSAAEIADRLAIPLTTLKYHVENLADAGLIEIVRTKWSSKGREVKVYGLTSRLIIVTPPVKDIRAILLKYASLFAVVIFASIVVAMILPLLGGVPAEEPRMMAFDAKGAGAPEATAAVPSVALDAVTAFFLGGSTVVLALMVYEVYLYFTYYRRRRARD
ncbi:ArsR/SmtB family transcription factor [Methanofollis tationis]|uniref:Helix-turn-helix domain-containing protein n=1 Tax=Methanofollis tationis TaxID=81417 RepID=A0A7K4HRL9_9EURY|nr:helix-turn-helix domain-containing protein [Methanofollis tationis]NVO67832.1 helix-turn-helix domain-containing protein [Methanofollis tationis]